jgi:hypothetical protein
LFSGWEHRGGVQVHVAGLFAAKSADESRLFSILPIYRINQKTIDAHYV